MKTSSLTTRQKQLSSSELVKYLTSVANEEGIGFAEAVRRTMADSPDKEIQHLLKAFNISAH